MINNIILKDVASYDAIDGVEIQELKKTNFFFGFNGSGKSTIAKFLYSLSLVEDERSSTFSNCCQNGFDSNTEQILVFDENFTDLNFIQNNQLKGIFSLNQQNDIIDNEIKKAETIINKNNILIEQKKSLKASFNKTKEKEKKKLLDDCWSKRDNFSIFSKLSLSYSGSKSSHFKEIERLLPTLPMKIPSFQEITISYKNLYESNLEKIETLIDSSLYKQIRYIENQLENLLNEIIVGNEDIKISQLIKQLNSRNWVEIGITFLDQTENICPFCQNPTINDDLVEQFNELFDESYKKKIELLNTFYKDYKKATGNFIDNISLIQNSYNKDNITSNLIIELKELFISNYSIIESKIKNSNERKIIISINSLKHKLSTLLLLIKKNNNDFLKLDYQKSKLINIIWYYITDNCKSQIEAYTTRESKYTKIDILTDSLIDIYKKNITTSQEVIENLRNQTINTKNAVDEINLILKGSGFESFEIAERSSINNIPQYFLKRPNSSDTNPIFKSLSEGEKSFISFLYFYQLCIGTDDIQNNGVKKKIIVIDDPVSSLDSQTLFVISSLIHRLLLRKGEANKLEKKTFRNENIEQIFILTHNIYFNS